jgi:hypothetical protein
MEQTISFLTSDGEALCEYFQHLPEVKVSYTQEDTNSRWTITFDEILLPLIALMIFHAGQKHGMKQMSDILKTKRYADNTTI